MRKQTTWISVRKNILGRENSHCKCSEEGHVNGEERRMKDREEGSREGKGRVVGNVTRKKLGSELLCLVGIVRNLKFS